MFTTLHRKAIIITSIFCLLTISYVQAMKVNSPTYRTLISKNITTPTEFHFAQQENSNIKKTDTNSKERDAVSSDRLIFLKWQNAQKV